MAPLYSGAVSRAGRPLRILQAHTFYQDYLDNFYAQNPTALRLSSQDQTVLLIQDGLAAIHIFTPYLKNLGCETQLVILNGAHVQQAWAQEHRLPLHGPWEADALQILRAQIDDFQPDVLYLVGDPARYNAAFFDSLQHRPQLIMSWRASDVPLGLDWTGYDIILSGLPRLLAFAKTAGAKEGLYFVPGMPNWIARAVENIPQDIDVVFIGSISPTQHVKRLALLDLVAQAAHKHGFSLALHLNCHPSLITETMRPYVCPPVFAMDMHRALRRGRIVLDTQGTIGLRRPDGSYALDLAQGDTSNMRIFEATGGESLLLTESLPGLSKLFEPKTEVATYKTGVEMIDKILYYLAHEKERQTIAAAGKARSLGQWNMQQCAKKFIHIVSNHLQDKAQHLEVCNDAPTLPPILEDPIPCTFKKQEQHAPTTFAIETVLGCNLRCVECAVGANLVRRPYGHMSLDKFLPIAERIRPYCRYAFLHIWGEPMINPDILPIINVASTFSKTNISTNANNLDDHLAKALIYSGVTDIIVSIDGMSQEIYSHYRRRGQLSKAQQGLLYLTKHRLRSGLSVSISPQFIVFAHNKHEMDDFAHFCQELGLTPAFKAPYLRNGSTLENSGLPEFERHIGKNMTERRRNMQSCAVHDTFTILLDGSVVACCYDHNGQSTFGNIYTQSLEEIWQAPAYLAFRKQVCTGVAPDYCVTHCLAY